MKSYSGFVLEGRCKSAFFLHKCLQAFRINERIYNRPKVTIHETNHFNVYVDFMASCSLCDSR